MKRLLTILLLMVLLVYGQESSWVSGHFSENLTTKNLYADTTAHYFAFAHIDSSGADSAYITTPGTWYQMQGTVHHQLIGFTKTATGLTYDGSDSMRFDHTIALNVRSTVVKATVSVGLSIAGDDPHVEMDVYCDKAGKYYSISLKDLGFICPGEKMRVVLTADRACGVYVGSGGVTSKPAGW